MAPGSRHITGPSDYVARYGAFQPQNFFQDLTYSPDMPTVTRVITTMYTQSGGDHIDGVLALDPEALGALLTLTGPVSVPQIGRLDPADAASILLRGQYATLPAASQQGARHDDLDDALTATLGKLVTARCPPRPRWPTPSGPRSVRGG